MPDGWQVAADHGAAKRFRDGGYVCCWEGTFLVGLIRVGERIEGGGGGGGQGKYKNWSPMHKMDCVRGVWGQAPREF